MTIVCPKLNGAREMPYLTKIIPWWIQDGWRRPKLVVDSNDRMDLHSPYLFPFDDDDDMVGGQETHLRSFFLLLCLPIFGRNRYLNPVRTPINGHCIDRLM